MQESDLILVKPTAHIPTSQKLAPSLSHDKQFLAQALQVPFTGVYPGLHLIQYS